MWMLKASEKLSEPTGVLFGRQFVGGYVLIDTWHEYYWFLKQGFTDVTPAFLTGTYQTPDRIAVVRHGGLGDLLIITPLVRAIKERWPKCEVTIVGATPNKPLLENNPNVDSIVHDVIVTECARSYDLYSDVYDLTQSIEMNPWSQVKNYYNLTLELYGLQSSNRLPTPELYPTDDERRVARDFFMEKGLLSPRKTLVGVSAKASNPIRSLPDYETYRIIDALEQEPDYQVVLYGDTIPGKNNSLPLRHACGACGYVFFSMMPKGVATISGACPKCKATVQTDATSATWKNVYNLGRDLSLRIMMTSMGLLDFHVTVDTGTMHIAGAWGVPQLLLTSSFDGYCPGGTLPNVTVMQKPYPCGPCFHYSTRCARMQALDTDNAPCMAQFTPEEVVARVKELMADPLRKSRPRMRPQVRDLLPAPCPACGESREFSRDFKCRRGDHAYFYCPTCHSLALDRPSVRDPKRYEDPIYDLVAKEQESSIKELGKVLLREYERVSNRAVGHIVDLGASSGHLLPHFMAAGWLTWAVGGDPRVLELQTQGKVAHALQADISTFVTTKDQQERLLLDGTILRGKRNSIQILVLNDVLESFWDYGMLLRPCIESLAFKGLLVVALPTYHHETNPKPSEWHHIDTPVVGDRTILYSPERFRGILEENGLIVRTVLTLDNAGKMAFLAQKNYLSP